MAKVDADAMVRVNDTNVCPKCKERKFKEIRNKGSYKSTILDNGIASDKQHLGLFWFSYKCANCNIEIMEYMNMERK